MFDVFLKGKKTYSFEGSTELKTWNIKVTHGIGLLTEEVKRELENFSKTIFFNDTDSSYWFMDYQIGDVWVEGFDINPCTMMLTIGLYK